MSMIKRGERYSRFDFGIQKENIAKSKRSQVTIFIILAIVIVAVLLILFYPRIKILVQPSTPSSYVEDCVKKELAPVLKTISEQGGSVDPQNTILYQDNKVEYLCYSNEYYKNCVMQQPILKQHVELEIGNYIQDKAEICMQELKDNYEGKGYSVTQKKGNVSVEIVPHSIKVTVNYPTTLVKGASETFDKFVVGQESEIYDLLMISESILNYEARYGDSAPETFMLYYPDIKIEKLKLGDSSKIYTVSNKETGDKLVFAVRSVAWPAGYGFDEELAK